MAQDVLFNNPSQTNSPSGGQQFPPQTPSPSTPNTPTASPTASSNPFPTPTPSAGLGGSPQASPRPSTTPIFSPGMPKTPPPPPMKSGFRLPFWIKVFIGIVIFFLILIILGAIFQSRNVFKQKVTITYWGLWENKSTMDQIFADFTRQYPNITVDYEEEDPNQYTDRLLTRVKNGNGPDVFTYHNSWVPEVLPILAPLSTDAITVNEFSNAFYPVAQHDLVQKGAIYGIPLEIDTLSLFVNDGILKAAGAQVPTTWDEFSNVASLTTVKDENQKIKTAGAAMGAYDNIVHASDILAMLFVQNGANLTDFTSTQQNASDALNFYGSFVVNANNVWDTSVAPSLVEFSQGNLAMYFGYSYDIFNIRALNPNLAFSVHVVPHLPSRTMTIASYWVDGVSIKSNHKKEAMLLMHYLAQKDTQEKMYSIESKTRSFGEPYARADLADTLKNNPTLYPFVSQAKDAVSTYFSSNTYDSGITAQMNGYIGNAIRSVISGASADSAVNTLGQGVTQILQQYGQQP